MTGIINKPDDYDVLLGNLDDLDLDLIEFVDEVLGSLETQLLKHEQLLLMLKDKLLKLNKEILNEELIISNLKKVLE